MGHFLGFEVSEPPRQRKEKPNRPEVLRTFSTFFRNSLEGDRREDLQEPRCCPTTSLKADPRVPRGLEAKPLRGV